MLTDVSCNIIYKQSEMLIMEPNFTMKIQIPHFCGFTMFEYNYPFTDHADRSLVKGSKGHSKITIINFH